MNKNIVLNPAVGDRVIFYVNVPVQNIGTTLESRVGRVKKVNRKTFIVVDGVGDEHRVAIEYHKSCGHIPRIVKN